MRLRSCGTVPASLKSLRQRTDVMISSLYYEAHFGGPFFRWRSENVAGWPNTDLKMLEIDPATCPNGQLHGTFETARYRCA